MGPFYTRGPITFLGCALCTWGFAPRPLGSQWGTLCSSCKQAQLLTQVGIEKQWDLLDNSPVTFLHKAGPEAEEERKDGKATASQDVKHPPPPPFSLLTLLPVRGLILRVGFGELALSEDPTHLPADPGWVASLYPSASPTPLKACLSHRRGSSAVCWGPGEEKGRTPFCGTSPVIPTVTARGRDVSLLIPSASLVTEKEKAAALAVMGPSPSPHTLLWGLVFYTRTARTGSQLLLVPEYKTPGKGSIFIPNLVSWWAHKLLPVKIATRAAMSPSA